MCRVHQTHTHTHTYLNHYLSLVNISFDRDFRENQFLFFGFRIVEYKYKQTNFKYRRDDSKLTKRKGFENNFIVTVTLT